MKDYFRKKIPQLFNIHFSLFIIHLGLLHFTTAPIFAYMRRNKLQLWGCPHGQCVTELVSRRKAIGLRSTDRWFPLGAFVQFQFDVRFIIRYCRGRVSRPGGKMVHFTAYIGKFLDDRLRDGKPVPYDPIFETAR